MSRQRDGYSCLFGACQEGHAEIAEALITALGATPGCRLLRLERELGATVLPGQTVLERAAWRWPV